MNYISIRYKNYHNLQMPCQYLDKTNYQTIHTFHETILNHFDTLNLNQIRIYLMINLSQHTLLF